MGEGVRESNTIRLSLLCFHLVKVNTVKVNTKTTSIFKDDIFFELSSLSLSYWQLILSKYL